VATSPNLVIQAEWVPSSFPANYPLLLDDSEYEISSDQGPYPLSHSSHTSPSRCNMCTCSGNGTQERAVQDLLGLVDYIWFI